MTRAAALNPSRPLAGPRWLWTLALAALLVIAGEVAWDRWRESGSGELDPATLQPWFGARNFAEAAAQADRDIAAVRQSLANPPGDWIHAEQLAMALIARWRLRGEYADLAEADRLLRDGMASAPDPAGPVLADATLAVLVHHLNRADVALARFARSVVPDPGESAEAAALAGDVALQRGDLAAAKAKYLQAVRFAPPATGDVRLAMLPALQSEHDRAIMEFELILAQPRHSPWTLASLMLHRAQLDLQRGDWTGAGRWTGASQRAFPGWWLADAHAAQQFALAGRTAEAIRAYRTVATRSQRPEVMDALAHLLRLEGQGAASRAWAAKAAAGWESRAALFPEAVIQHRAEHELAVGSVARALKLAQADVAARPGPQGIALLARALILSGRPREALGWLDQSRDAGFVSAGALMLRADAHAALGDSAASAIARDQALAINPKAADPAARLIWFGHD